MKFFACARLYYPLTFKTIQALGVYQSGSMETVLNSFTYTAEILIPYTFWKLSPPLYKL